MKSTKIFALLLVVLMCFSMLASCGLFGGNQPDNEKKTDDGKKPGDGGTPNPPEGVVYDIFGGDPDKDYRDEGFYTMLDYMSGTSGLDWNPFTWEDNDDSYPLGFITTPLYDFVLNSTKDGYTIVPEAAVELPIDVTADYVGQYGIKAGEEGKAWLVKLNPLVTWGDGEKINAETYEYSMKQLLDPIALNRRADSFYSGDFEVVNAKAYFYDGKVSYAMVGSDLDKAYENGTPLYVDMWDFYGLEGCPDAEGNECPRYVLIDDETLYRDLSVAEGEDGDWITAKMIYEMYFAPGAVYESYAPQYLFTSQALPKVEWNEVGCKAVSEYELLIVTANPIEEPGFYLPYNLSSYPLVRKNLYEASQTWYNEAGEEVAAGSSDVFSVTTTYCKSVDPKTAAALTYGPYAFTYFELDKQLTFERNNNWYGYSDGLHYGQYQTDKISCQVISEHKTILESFLAGGLDSVGLESSDMAIYASSDRLLYTPQDYTTKLTFNTDEEALREIGGNAVILTIKEFREAFSLAIDREKFCAAYTAAHEPGYGLLNYLYCYNPFTGEIYRDSDYAKKALVDLYGLEYGSGKDYADLDEAYDAITGYDPTKAKALMKVAAEKAIADNLWDGTSDIVLDFRVYSSDEIYVKMFTFFDESLKAVCAGTPFEDKISLQMTEDPDYYVTMYSGQATIIFSTWGGNPMGPFSMFYQCYCDASDGSGNQMEYGYDTSKVSVTLEVAGKTVTASLQDWAHWCNGDAVAIINNDLGKFVDYDYDVRCEVFAQLENIYLSSFVTTPIYYRNSASLLSRKVEYATTDYIQLVSYGGIRYITYNYTDAQWDSVKTNINY